MPPLRQTGRMRLIGHLGRWSLARQLLVLQVIVVLIVVSGSALVAYLNARSDADYDAEAKVIAVAVSVADSPAVVDALDDPDPSAALQPYAEAVREDAEVDFVVVMGTDRIRYSHPNEDLIGQPFIGSIAPALDGTTFTETYTGTLGPSVRAVTPVTDSDGTVRGLVSVGITISSITRDLRGQVVLLVGVALLALAVGGLCAYLVSRWVRRQTHGMGTAALARMYEYYDSVLHSVREGLLLVDRHRTLSLSNDEARRLLELPSEPDGRAVGELGLPAGLTDVLTSGRACVDEIFLTGQRVLVVNQTPAQYAGRDLGTVVTLRDHTDLQALSGELDTVRGLAESLRSQAHEAANRLHTVVSLIELGRVREAVEFATEELHLAQALTDRVVEAVEEPVLAALLLGKAAQASERGVDLVITADTEVGEDLGVEPRDLVTILGNLLDNAIDAAQAGPVPRRVEVTVRDDRRDSGVGLLLRVADTGVGLDAEQVQEAFRRGWSTKSGDPLIGRGLGLALVGQTVRRHGGVIEVGKEVGAVFEVWLPLPGPVPAGERTDTAQAPA